MRRTLLVIAGIVFGVAAAARFASSMEGRAMAQSLDSRAREFGEAVAEAYRQRQADLRAAIDQGSSRD